MKYAKVLSLQQFGVNGCPVALECRQSVHLPAFHMLGCSLQQARGIRERVFSALESSGFRVPSRKITIQIHPEFAREGTQALDLAVALAILTSEGLIPEVRLRNIIVLGGLHLDGSLAPVPEAMALPTFFAEKRFRSALLPYENSHILEEEQLNEGGGFHSLLEAVEFLRRTVGNGKRAESPSLAERKGDSTPLRLEQIQGQASAKYLMLLTAAGGHHTLLYGPRGMGKSFLANALPGIFPPLSLEESREIQAVYSLSGEPWPSQRPFRAPHASISRNNLIGGLGKNKFGEMSLAHGGILFLDEILEMDKHVLESLRVPLEFGEIQLRRGDLHFRLPCRITLVAAGNLCPCGLQGDPRHQCSCTRNEIRHYARRLSAAFLDRLDLAYTISPEGTEEYSDATTAGYRIKATLARDRMMKRQGQANALLRGEEIFRRKPWKKATTALWLESSRERGFSHRGALSVARVALTASDLRDAEYVEEEDLMQALYYRAEPKY